MALPWPQSAAGCSGEFLTVAEYFVFNLWTVLATVYLGGLALTAAYHLEHPPTDCSACNNLFALTWPSIPLLKLLRRNPHA